MILHVLAIVGAIQAGGMLAALLALSCDYAWSPPAPGLPRVDAADDLGHLVLVWPVTLFALGCTLGTHLTWLAVRAIVKVLRR